MKLTLPVALKGLDFSLFPTEPEKLPLPEQRALKYHVIEVYT
jgi:hypothetical protein